MKFPRYNLLFYSLIFVFSCTNNGIAAPASSKIKLVSTTALTNLKAGRAQEFIIEFNDDAIQFDAAKKILKEKLKSNDRPIINYKKNRYTQLKSKTLSVLLATQYDIIVDYENLPMSLIRIKSERSLTDLVNQTNVKTVFPNEIRKAHLVQSLPLIKHSSAAPLGATGVGTAVAVLDTGLDYTNSTFGCTSPGVPATCKVIHAEDIGIDDGALDNVGHGTTMASIVTNVAPQANIVALDVFLTTTTTDDATVIAGINRSITLNNLNAYNIQTINLSLGGISADTTCAVYDSAVLAAANAGIVIFASAGNDATNQIGCPANNPNIVSIGAVYDANVGGLTFSVCADTSTAADKIACFSDGKASVDLFAPGALITVNGITGAGTSQASAFASGSSALISNALPVSILYPDANSWVNSLKKRIISSDVTILDSATGITAPRINIATALRPPNNDFINPDIMTSSYIGTNINATVELGEPSHAGNVGGKSIWIKLSNSSDNVKINSYGSNFDTLIAVYTGTSVSGLNLITENDDDGTVGGKSSITLNKSATTNYFIAVDGKNGLFGYVALAEQILAPSNDNFIAAQIITGNSGSLVLNNTSNTLATIETGEPVHAGQVSERSVWFTWTAPVSAQIIIDTHGSNFDTLLGVYIGSNVSALTEIISNDDDGFPNGTSSVSFFASAGQIYHIAVAKKAGSAGTGSSINLNWTINASTVVNENVPTLPEWAMIFLAGLLLLLTIKFTPSR